MVHTSAQKGGEFGGAGVWLGAAVESISTSGVYTLGDNNSTSIDEFRIWSYARKATQVKRDMTHKFDNETVGLEAYYPFENYQEDAGVNVLESTLSDESSKNAGNAIAEGTVNLEINTAPVKLINPIEKVNYNYVVNGDKVLFDINEAPFRIENTHIDVTVTKVEDLLGNKMELSEAWTFYVDRNQVKWLSPVLSFEIKKGEIHEENLRITNYGGEDKHFTIEGIPSWMELSLPSGTLEPQSSIDIKMTVLEGLNVGNYTESLSLVTDDFSDVMDLNISVKADAPDWKIENDYHDEKSMNVIGAVKIDGVYERDANTMIAASINGKVKGVANLEYLKEYDKYVFFMDVYNYYEDYGAVHFEVWDADKGTTYIDLDPVLDFKQDTIHGSIDEPLVLEPKESVRTSYPLKKGWNWVSFNITNTYQDRVNTYLHSISGIAEILKSKTTFDTYYSGYGWYGNITWYDGLQNDQMYMVRMKYDANMRLQGAPVSVSDTINLKAGWNWLAYLPQENMEINDALAQYDAKHGDVVKGKTGFAIYNQRIGWEGSLNYLEPGKGYKLHTSNNGILTYPKTARWSPTNARIALQTENDFTQFASNMSIVASFGDDEVKASDVLRVFVNEELRGETQAGSVEGNSLFFLTIHGDTDGQVLKFVLVRDGEEIILTEDALNYQSDLVVGDITNPHLLRKKAILAEEEELSSLSVSPNPFKDIIQISFESLVSGSLEIELCDISGRIVLSETRIINKFKHETIDTSDLPNGLYLLKVKSGNVLQVLKMSKN